MTLQEYISSISTTRQFELAIRFARLALPLWEAYAAREELTYQDSVVGMKHSVEKELLEHTIDAVESFLANLKSDQEKLLSYSGDFTDPIVALQDGDWELPYGAEKVFYSVHNLLEAALGNEKTVFDEATIYVSINQSIDGLIHEQVMTEEEIRGVLYGE
ncbi:MAG: hypothetical protein NTW29_16600 [Bacteroidetes bacterium]|nr:hypothetical protein [Bacteroidota bacterium]